MDVINIVEKRKSMINTLKNNTPLKSNFELEKYRTDNLDDVYSFDKKEQNYFVCGFSYEKIKYEEEPICDNNWVKINSKDDYADMDLKNLIYRSKSELSHK